MNAVSNLLEAVKALRELGAVHIKLTETSVECMFPPSFESAESVDLALPEDPSYEETSLRKWYNDRPTIGPGGKPI